MDLITSVKKCAGSITNEAGTYNCPFTFPLTFEGFDGHFPENPILPGVIQTIIGEICVQQILDKLFPQEKFELKTITRCKFTRPLRPEEKIDLNFSIKAKDQHQIGICKLSVNGEQAAAYQLVFDKEQS